MYLRGFCNSSHLILKNAKTVTIVHRTTQIEKFMHSLHLFSECFFFFREIEGKRETELRLTCPLALGWALSLTIDGGARWCDRTRWCNLSPSKRQHSRLEEKPKTSEAVKNCRNGTLSRAKAFPAADCPNIYIACAHPFPRRHQALNSPFSATTPKKPELHDESFTTRRDPFCFAF